jgi:hypothetical protein
MKINESRYEELLRLLPEGWEAKAKELGAFKRARIIKTPGELLHLILLYLSEGKSLAGTGALLKLLGKKSPNKTAIHKRIGNSKDWLKWLCQNIFRQAGLLIEKPKELKNYNIIVVDGTKDSSCETEKQYFIFHYSLDLFTLSTREILLTTDKVGEKLSNFTNLGPSDIVMGDRGFGTLTGIRHLMSLEAGYILRLRAGCFNIYDKDKNKLDLYKQFDGLKEGEAKDINLYCIINGKLTPIRICALRKDKASEEEGLKKLIRTNQREHKGKALTDLQRESNKYIVLATSLGDEMPASKVLELYRVRWQIEIYFKRLKSLFAYDEVPAKLPNNIEVWFYVKLLLAALAETLVNIGRFSSELDDEDDYQEGDDEDEIELHELDDKDDQIPSLEQGEQIPIADLVDQIPSFEQSEQIPIADLVEQIPSFEQSGKITQPKLEEDIGPERFSLWRELRAVYTLIVSALLEGLNNVPFLKHLKRLRYDCADSKRKRIPQLHIFSSA